MEQLQLKKYESGKAVVIEYNGTKYRRYPNAKQTSDRKYYIAGIVERMHGKDYLHRQIYRDFHGPIPEGYHVHHIDEDTENNHPANLRAITKEDHAKHHAETLSPERRALYAEIIVKYGVPKAKEWHRSPEGRAWHSLHAKEIVKNRKKISLQCQKCGKQYECFYTSKNKFCVNNCKSAARRDSGADDESRNCKSCGAEFKCNRYAVKQFCSCSCRFRKKNKPDCSGLQSHD